MKNLLKISVAMMLALFLITSCSKKKDAPKPDDKKEVAITQAEMQNKANPYDEQGNMYNGFLNAMASDSGGIGGWDVGQLAQFNGDIGGWDVGQLAENNGDIGGWDVGQIVNAAMDFYGSQGKDFGDGTKRNLSTQLKVFSSMNISEHNDCWLHPDWCKDFVNPVEILNVSNGGTLHDRTIKYINAVREKEVKLMGNDKMNQAEKDGLLICYSIARHAAGYWYNETRNNKPNGKFTFNIVRLSTLGASTAFISTDTKEVGVGTAILSAYIATVKMK